MDILNSNQDNDEIQYLNITLNSRKYFPFKNLGYSPQQLSLLPYLTVNQILKFYLKKSDTDEESDKKINALIFNLGLLPYADVKIRYLSQGNKTKLQIAIAMLNSPNLIILDSPFTFSLFVNQLICFAKNENTSLSLFITLRIVKSEL